MTPKQREVMRQALEALEDLQKYGVKQSRALFALREALEEQPVQQKPYAFDDDIIMQAIRCLCYARVRDDALLKREPHLCSNNHRYVAAIESLNTLLPENKRITIANT